MDYRMREGNMVAGFRKDSLTQSEHADTCLNRNQKMCLIVTQLNHQFRLHMWDKDKGDGQEIR